MSASRWRFSRESKDELCREVNSTSKTIKAVATEYGVGAETLRNWLRKYPIKHAAEAEASPLTLDERARLRELERENRACQVD